MVSALAGFAGLAGFPTQMPNCSKCRSVWEADLSAYATKWGGGTYATTDNIIKVWENFTNAKTVLAKLGLQHQNIKVTDSNEH